jgi:hypothetical protein
MTLPGDPARTMTMILHHPAAVTPVGVVETAAVALPVGTTPDSRKEEYDASKTIGKLS